MRYALLAIALFAVSGCDATYTTRVICRGDSVEADYCDTCLVRCSTVDTLARR